MENIKEIKLSKNNFTIVCDNSSLKLNYENKQDAYVVDISNMNLINATKIAILCSTYCFINDFKKKLCWVVQDEEIKKAISILRLGNIQNCFVANTKKERLVSA